MYAIECTEPSHRTQFSELGCALPNECLKCLLSGSSGLPGSEWSRRGMKLTPGSVLAFISSVPVKRLISSLSPIYMFLVVRGILPVRYHLRFMYFSATMSVWLADRDVLGPQGTAAKDDSLAILDPKIQVYRSTWPRCMKPVRLQIQTRLVDYHQDRRCRRSRCAEPSPGCKSSDNKPLSPI